MSRSARSGLSLRQLTQPLNRTGSSTNPAPGAGGVNNRLMSAFPTAAGSQLPMEVSGSNYPSRQALRVKEEYRRSRDGTAGNRPCLR